MRKTIKSSLMGALLVTAGVAAFTDHASAAPMNMMNSRVIEAPSPTAQIHYRRYYPRHYGYYRHYRHYGYSRHYYGRYGYSGYNNPVGAAAGAAAGLATLPLRAVFGNPYYY